jgi:hypothetical protein
MLALLWWLCVGKGFHVIAPIEWVGPAGAH